MTNCVMRVIYARQAGRASRIIDRAVQQAPACYVRAHVRNPVMQQGMDHNAVVLMLGHWLDQLET